MKTARKTHCKWNDEYYVEVYDLAKTGLSNTAIAEVIDVSYPTLKRWIASKPALRKALKKARNSDAHPGKPREFMEYIYKLLPPDVQEVWNQLTLFEKTKNSIRKAELLKKQPDKIRQFLFIHALISSRFNVSEACRKVEVSKDTYDRWTLADAGFSKLIEEVLWHKANFFESALTGLVSQGDTSATIFANKTFNRSRGYDTKTEIHVTGNLLHGHVDLDTMNVPLDVRRQLLDAARAKIAASQPEMVLIEHQPQEVGGDE